MDLQYCALLLVRDVDASKIEHLLNVGKEVLCAKCMLVSPMEKKRDRLEYIIIFLCIPNLFCGFRSSRRRIPGWAWSHLPHLPKFSHLQHLHVTWADDIAPVSVTTAHKAASLNRRAAARYLELASNTSYTGPSSYRKKKLPVRGLANVENHGPKALQGLDHSIVV